MIETRNRELKEIEAARIKIKSDMDNVESQKREKDATINTILEEIGKIEVLLKGSQVPELNNRASQIEEEIQRLESRIRDIEAGINAVTLERKYAQVKIDETRQRLLELDIKKEEHRVKINGLKESIKTFESDLNLKRSREKELGGELLELQDKRALVQKEHSSLKGQAHGYRKAENRYRQEFAGIIFHKRCIDRADYQA